MNLKKKIIIAGFGFVGKAVFNAIKDHHTCYVVDPLYSDTKINDYSDIDGIIICVGTPSLDNGSCDDSQLRNVLSQAPKNVPILVKSTVTPDKLLKLSSDFQDNPICYSPEFLRANTAESDFIDQKFLVLGGEDPDDFWHVLLMPALSQCKLFFKCTLVEASTIKYAINSFLATKVSFFNHIYDLCQSNGADYDIVRQIITHDQRIGNSHTLVPGPDGDRGFGGHCFPKDTKALISYADSLDISLDILKTAINYNKTVRKTLDL